MELNSSNITANNRMDFIIESKDYVKRCLTYVRRSYRLSDAEFGHYLENVSHPEPGRKS